MAKTFISDIIIGLVIVGLGIWTWKKQNLVILHEYHYKNVKPEDIPAYTDRKSTRLNSSHPTTSRMPSSA